MTKGVAVAEEKRDPVDVLRHDEREWRLSLDEYERRCILRAMRACGGHAAFAARILGVGKSTLYRRLNKHKITWDKGLLRTRATIDLTEMPMARLRTAVAEDLQAQGIPQDEACARVVTMSRDILVQRLKNPRGELK